MTITQDMLIKQIAKKEGEDVATVRRIFHAAEHFILYYLSSTSSNEDTIIKVLNGIQVEGTFIPEQIINKGMFQNVECPKRIKVKSNVSRHYNRKLNQFIL